MTSGRSSDGQISEVQTPCSTPSLAASRDAALDLGVPSLQCMLSVHAFWLAMGRGSSPGGVTCDEQHFAPRSTRESHAAQERAQRAAAAVTGRHLTFLDHKALQMHTDWLLEMESSGRTGMVLECGVAKAGSAIVMAAAKRPERCLHLFDTFSGLPPPSSRDGEDIHRRYKVIQSGKAGADYYGYMHNLLDFDRRMFEEVGYNASANAVSFHKGLFNETVRPAGPVAYAHIDGDWYDSVFGVLGAIEPFMTDGGVIVLDDVEHWSGARKAYMDFFNTNLSAIPRTSSNRTKGADLGATTGNLCSIIPCITRHSRGGARFELFYHMRYGAIRRAEPSPSHPSV
mmetsp:Transcript_27032/g.85993  ORF Transcript_27032/g.85993 Transcript_27032/m.85993 type:complete len:342 (-) Transcript_27032:182-1207(-)